MIIRPPHIKIINIGDNKYQIIFDECHSEIPINGGIPLNDSDNYVSLKHDKDCQNHSENNFDICKNNLENSFNEDCQNNSENNFDICLNNSDNNDDICKNNSDNDDDLNKHDNCLNNSDNNDDLNKHDDDNCLNNSDNILQGNELPESLIKKLLDKIKEVIYERFNQECQERQSSESQESSESSESQESSESSESQESSTHGQDCPDCLESLDQVIDSVNPIIDSVDPVLGPILIQLCTTFLVHSYINLSHLICAMIEEEIKQNSILYTDLFLQYLLEYISTKGPEYILTSNELDIITKLFLDANLERMLDHQLHQITHDNMRDYIETHMVFCPDCFNCAYEHHLHCNSCWKMTHYEGYIDFENEYKRYVYAMLSHIVECEGCKKAIIYVWID